MAETTKEQIRHWREQINRFGFGIDFDTELDLPLLLLDAEALHELEPAAAAMERTIQRQAGDIDRLRRKLAMARTVLGNVKEAISMWTAPIGAAVQKIDADKEEPGS